MNFGNFHPLLSFSSLGTQALPLCPLNKSPSYFHPYFKKNHPLFGSNRRQWVDDYVSWFNPLTRPTLARASVFFRAPGPGERRAGAPGVPPPSRWTAVICSLPTRDPARSCPDRRARIPAPMSLIPLAAVARSAPHDPLRLLARRLGTMAEPLKSVDYEVFGTVQGMACPGRPSRGSGRERRKLAPSILGMVFSQSERLPLSHDTAALVGRTGSAHAWES